MAEGTNISAGYAIIYRAHRLRFLIASAILVPSTIGIGMLGYIGFTSGGIRDAWLMPIIGALYLWFSFVVVVKAIWPPEFDVSHAGFIWKNYALLESGVYDWNSVDGPEPTSGSGGVPLLQFTIKATGRKLKLPPSHFGATYDEMAAVVDAARSGRTLTPEEWRRTHPKPGFTHWLHVWGIPLALAGAVGFALAWFTH